MGTATIHLSDEGDDLKITVSFDGNGADLESIAHAVALGMVRSVTGSLSEGEEDGVCGHG